MYSVKLMLDSAWYL